METNETRKEKYSKMMLRDKKISKKKKPNVTFTFLEKCRRNPPPQDAQIIWRRTCVSSRHVRICT
jgi:hypothetical protein